MDRFVVISADCHAVGPSGRLHAVSSSPGTSTRSTTRTASSIELAREARKASEDGGLLFSRETLDEYHGARGDRGRRRSVAPSGSGTPIVASRSSRTTASSPKWCSRTAARSSPVAVARRAARAAHRRTARVQPLARRLLRAGAGSARRDRAAADPRRRPLDRRDRDAAAAEGLKGVTVPILFDDPDAPPLYHERYAADVGRVRGARHAGARARWCRPRLRRRRRHAAGIMLYVTEVPMWPKRILWFLPALERHARTPPRPATGVHRGHVRLGAGVVSYLDYLYESKDFAHIRPVLPMKPSEYWQRQCYVGVVVRVACGDRHALRHRRRQHDVRLRLPARRRHVAAHLRLGARRRSAAFPRTSSA